jgi:glycerate kinase
LLEGCTIVAPIPQHLLIVGGSFGPNLTAERVLEAIARGVTAAGRPAPDRCPLDAGAAHAPDFDERMRAARAVIVADARLSEHALAGSATFEIATRARQSGVPAYALTAHDELNAFDARILDLQLVLEADGPAALTAAGRRLAEIA